jgi:hypothetical protein
MIYINTNAEIITDQVDYRLLPEHESRKAVAEMVIEARAEVTAIALDAGLDYKPESSYRAWQGSRLAAHYYGALVAFTEPAERPTAIKMADAIHALIARLTALEIASAKGNSLNWVDSPADVAKLAGKRVAEVADTDVTSYAEIPADMPLATAVEEYIDDYQFDEEDKTPEELEVSLREEIRSKLHESFAPEAQ